MTETAEDNGGPALLPSETNKEKGDEIEDIDDLQRASFGIIPTTYAPSSLIWWSWLPFSLVRQNGAWQRQGKYASIGCDSYWRRYKSKLKALGVLSLPYVCKLCGLALGLILLLLGYSASAWSFSLIIKTDVKSGGFKSFKEFCLNTGGRKLMIFYNLVVIFTIYGTLIGYQVISMQRNWHKRSFHHGSASIEKFQRGKSRTIQELSYNGTLIGRDIPSVFAQKCKQFAICYDSIDVINYLHDCDHHSRAAVLLD